MTPVRTPSNHSNTLTGKFPSLKMGRMISYESTVERDFIYLLEYEKHVSEFEEQPVIIEYPYQGKKCHYTPDFYATIKTKGWVFECKPERFINTAENERKFEAADYWCSQQGWNFSVITSENIRAGSYLKNINYLWYFSKLDVCPELQTKIATVLWIETEPLSIAKVVEKVHGFDHAQIIPAIYKMAFFHEVNISIGEELITPDTCLQLNKGKDCDYEDILPFFLRNTIQMER